MARTKKTTEVVAEKEEIIELGYISPCEMYAAVPYGNQFIIIHNGFQIRLCRNLTTAKNFINQHKKKKK